METVNEVKKILDINFEKVRMDLKQFQSLKSTNRQSQELNEFFLSRKSGNQDNENNVNNELTVKFDFTSGPIDPIINNKYLKSLHEFGINMFEKNNSAKPTLKSPNDFLSKKPFLKKGDGLKRFSHRNVDKNEKTHKIQCNKNHTDKLPTKNIDQKHKTDNQRKVKFVTKKSTDLPPVASKINCKLPLQREKKADINYNELCESIEKLTSKVLIDENSNLNDAADLNNFRLKIGEEIWANNNIKTIGNLEDDNKGLTFESQEDTVDTLRVKEQIRKFEKRLVDLKAIKIALGEIQIQENNIKHENFFAFLENIKKDISILNDKISGISISNKQLESCHENEFNLEQFAKSKDFLDIEYNADSTIYKLANGDKITILRDQTLIYHYLNGTAQTIYPDGLKVIEFKNGQIEKVHINGTKQIIYPDNQQRIIKPDKTEEIFLNDGRIFTIFPDGSEKIEYKNGDVEFKTNEYTKREYKDGNTKTVYSNGCEETIYRNGRIRLKDKMGNIIYDQMACD